MEDIKYILGLPEFVEGVGNIYPIKVEDYDIFSKNTPYLLYSKKHFGIPESEIDNHKLLDVLLGVGKDTAIQGLTEIFSLVLQTEVSFGISETGNDYAFIIDENFMINNNNYDLVRGIILKQNLIFEPKVFKDKLVQQWAEKVLEARRKNSVKINMEDIITTVSITKGISYSEIAKMTLYQLNADFKRLGKYMGYKKDITLLAAGASIKSIEHYAEEIDMFKDPYSDLFVKKEKLNKLNNALG